ncbi:DUF4292 domain-containing protein [Candidatus Poribacteria bacterium]|nr:DUF4292 domain-containing protein [Candidatus Poribacteria bacterium]
MKQSFSAKKSEKLFYFLFSRFLVFSFSRSHLLLCTIVIGIFGFLPMGCHRLGGGQIGEQISGSDQLILKNIISELKTRYDMVETLKTQMNVIIETKNNKQEVREYLWYERPDKLKIYALGALNEPKVVVLAVEESFTMVFIQEKKAIKAQLTDEVLTKIFNLDLRVSDVRNAIFANPFLDGNTKNIRLTHSGDNYLLQRPSLHENHTEEITVALIKNVDVVVTNWKILNSKGNIMQEIEFDDYRGTGGILRPLKVAIHRPVEGTAIYFNAVQPEINAEFKDDVFRIELPPGTEIQTLQ